MGGRRFPYTKARSNETVLRGSPKPPPPGLTGGQVTAREGATVVDPTTNGWMIRKAHEV